MRKIHGHIREVYGWGTWIRTRISGVRVPAASSCLPRLKPGTVLSCGDRASFTGAAFGQYASFTGGVVFGAQASFEFAAFDSAATLQTSTPLSGRHLRWGLAFRRPLSVRCLAPTARSNRPCATTTSTPSVFPGSRCRGFGIAKIRRKRQSQLQQ